MDDRRAEDGVQAPCPEAGAGAALPLREEAADGGPGERGSLGACWQTVRCQGATCPMGRDISYINC